MGFDHHFPIIFPMKMGIAGSNAVKIRINHPFGNGKHTTHKNDDD